jgi:hypothetical protein
MASAPALVLVAGGITAANEVLFAPVATGKAPDFNWRIIPATALLALAMGGLENVSSNLAQLLSWTMVITVCLAPIGNAPAPIENINKALGIK